MKSQSLTEKRENQSCQTDAPGWLPVGGLSDRIAASKRSDESILERPLAPETRNRDEASDEQLMEGILKQNSGDFEELHRRHYSRLRNTALGVIRCNSDAEDLLQVVVLSLWNGRSKGYDPSKGRPLGWLITMVRRRAIDLLRSQVTYVKKCQSYQVDRRMHPFVASRPVEHEVDVNAYRMMVQSALKCLPDGQRAALRLAYVSGLSHRAIAAQLDMPGGTIKTRINLALQKVKRCLASVARELESSFGTPVKAVVWDRSWEQPRRRSPASMSLSLRLRLQSEHRRQAFQTCLPL